MIEVRLERLRSVAGNAEVSLDSTSTAHRFHSSRRYEDSGAPGEKCGLITYPMNKRLGGSEEITEGENVRCC